MRYFHIHSIIPIIVAIYAGSCFHGSSRARISEKVAFQLEDNASCVISNGGIIRGDTSSKHIALVFTGDEFADGGEYIISVLKDDDIKASFFLTGNFYRNPAFRSLVNNLKKEGHYLGSHSDRHLLYCDWIRRDSLLVTKEEFLDDLRNSYRELEKINISRDKARFFLPPYEWYNDSISEWTKEAELQLVNFTPGTLSTADYTFPETGARYFDSQSIYNSILDYEKNSRNGLNGFILLLHIGTDPRRTDKFYFYLPSLLKEIKKRGYRFVRIDELPGISLN